MKGKNCEVCKDSRLKRFYIRNYFTGYSFKNNPIGERVGKSSFKSVGWICEKCGIVKFDKEHWRPIREIEERDETTKRVIVDFMRTILSLKARIRRNKKYIHTKEDIEYGKKIHAIMFTRVRHEIAMYKYSRGYKKGSRDSNKHWKQYIEDNKLTDDQILAKAETIRLQRKLGFK